MTPLLLMRKSQNVRADKLALLVFCVAFVLSSAIAQGGATVNPTPRTQEQIRIASLITNVHNVVAVLEQHGVRFNSSDLNSLTNLVSSSSSEAIERILSRHILFQVHINPEMRVKVARGSATASLHSGAWRYFLARIENESGTTAPLQGESPQRIGNPAAASDAWLEMKIHDDASLPAKLSDQPVEYRVIALRTEVAGQREARINFHVGQGTQDIGFRNEVDILFHCAPNKPDQAASATNSQ